MLFGVWLFNPPLYFLLKRAAELRHAAVGMDAATHQRLMKAVYPI